MIAKNLLKKHRIMSDQIRPDEMLVLLTSLEDVLKQGIDGDVVELGCYEGTSALFEARMLERMSPDKKLWLYDSFEGLPEKTNEDATPLGEAFTAGALKASKAVLAKNFVKAGLKIPEIKRAWFYELDPEDLPEHICFAFLDGDFYESIMDSMKLVLPKMTTGSMIIIDDYQNPKLPGAKQAVDEYVHRYNLKMEAQKSLAIVRF
jgi:O-methyltransferase